MKKTRRSLVLSVLSFMLCVVMLIGTTFAWFTDSVTSGKNKITAGNLDVELTHSNAKVTDQKVQSATDLFVDKDGNAMLWEPGAVSYENLTVSNVGDLALKYKLNMNVTDYNAVKGTNDTLLDALKVIVLTGDDMLDTIDRDSVLALSWASAQSLGDFNKNDGKLYPAGTAGKDSTETFQLIVYWQPTDDDNRWNLKNGAVSTDGQPLFVEFGVNLVATQLEFESDSFNELYDKDLNLPVLPQNINKKFETTKITTNISSGVEITKIDGDTSKASDETIEVVNKSNNTGVGTIKAESATSVVSAMVEQVGTANIKPDSDQDTVIFIEVETTVQPTTTGAEYDITLSAKMTYTDSADVEQTVEIAELTETQLGSKIVEVTIDLGANLTNVSVSHKGTPMEKLAAVDTDAEGFFYNATSGVLTIKSKSFSPFQVYYTQKENADQCQHGTLEAAPYDPYCHTNTCTICNGYGEREVHTFGADFTCTECGYVANVGTITLYGTDPVIIITDANKGTAELNTALAAYNLTWDTTTNGLKLTGDTEIGQIDCKVDANGKGGAVLDLNGYVLTNNSWTGFDMHKNYSLAIIDSNPTAEHTGNIYDYNDDGYHYYIWAANAESLEKQTPAYTVKTPYTINGGIITNKSGDKNAQGVGEPHDGGGMSTEAGVKLHFYGGTIAGVNSDGDTGAICLGRDWNTPAAEAILFEGSAIVGCHGWDCGGIESRSGDVKIYGGKIDYCAGYNFAGAVYTWAGSNFEMLDGVISNCVSSLYFNSGYAKLLGGTIENCSGQSIIWNADAEMLMQGVTLKNCNVTDFMMIQFPWDDGNPTMTIAEGTKFINCTVVGTGPAVSDMNPVNGVVLGGDFSEINSTNVLFASVADGMLSVKGGKYNVAHKAEIQTYLDADYKIVDIDANTFSVVAK